MAGIQRRRFIQIAALATVFAGRSALAGEGQTYTWTGRALGAEAEITLTHESRGAAEAVVGKAVAEVRRLEGIFSLYNENSSIRQLNRDGYLTQPPLEFLSLLSEAKSIADETGGRFDITVQPVWDLYRDRTPTDQEIADALQKVGADGVLIDPGEVRFARDGMAITLNGIAQGFITDRITELLRAEGFSNVLVNLGEFSGVGSPPDRDGWTVGIKGQDQDVIDRVLLKDRAMATSEPGSFIFDPRTGRAVSQYRSVSVLADNATRADGLSTAFMQMSPAEISAFNTKNPSLGTLITDRDDQILRFGRV